MKLPPASTKRSTICLARGLVRLVAERHGAEAQLRDSCARAAELAVFHGCCAPHRVAGTLRPRALRRWLGGGGRNRTHRTGFARPTRFEDEGGHQTPFTSLRILPHHFVSRSPLNPRVLAAKWVGARRRSRRVECGRHPLAERDHREEVPVGARRVGARCRGRVQGARRRLISCTTHTASGSFGARSLRVTLR